MSVSWAVNWSLGTQFWPMNRSPLALIAMLSCDSVTPIFSGCWVDGRATSTPDWRSGVTTMKMISSTRHTSTSGVTLISLLTSPPNPGGRMAPALRLGPNPDCMTASVLLDEEVDQLRGGVRHLHLEALEHVDEV